MVVKKQVIKTLLISPRVWLVVGALLFCVLTFVAAAFEQTGLEGKLFLTIYNWPASLVPLFLAITVTGSSMMFLALIILSYLFSRDRWFVRIFSSGVMAYVVSLSVKWILQSPRPVDLLLDIVPRDPHVAGFGFPSAHVAFTTAVGLGIYDLVPKRTRPFLILWIIAVGLSRMYLGVHVPLDILGGFALGLAIAGFVRLLYGEKKFWRQKKIEKLVKKA